ncbi:hypothetical protein [Kitasatospora sp. NPDC088783]|uniref:hypothetical protein n=1 Tax=Kitasatospora sp. NPDC088783 TaxID=3364077 RepID=UPI00382A1379
MTWADEGIEPAHSCADETAHAARLLDSLGPDPTAEQPVTTSHAAGLAILLLDAWSTSPAGVPAGLLAATALPAGHWRGERAATDVLALVRKGRVHRSVQKLIVHPGGCHVTAGTALAAVLTWAQRTSTPPADIAQAQIG